jgi:hypothetical protein
MRNFVACLIFLTSLSFFGCARKNSGNAEKVFYSKDALTQHMVADKIILVTCTRCGCFVDALNNLASDDYEYISTFPVLNDTNCNRLKIPNHYIDRKAIDSISTDLYNVVLIKRSNGHYQFKILSLSESANIAIAIRNYFDE